MDSEALSMAQMLTWLRASPYAGRPQPHLFTDHSLDLPGCKFAFYFLPSPCLEQVSAPDRLSVVRYELGADDVCFSGLF